MAQATHRLERHAELHVERAAARDGAPMLVKNPLLDSDEWYERSAAVPAPRILKLVTNKHVEQRAANLDVPFVVVDETLFAELVHEYAHARSRGPYHLCERVLTDFVDPRL